MGLGMVLVGCGNAGGLRECWGCTGWWDGGCWRAGDAGGLECRGLVGWGCWWAGGLGMLEGWDRRGWALLSLAPAGPRPSPPPAPTLNSCCSPPPPPLLPSHPPPTPPAQSSPAPAVPSPSSPPPASPHPPLPPHEVLTGPVRALTFLLVYGLLSLALGAAWAAHLPWWLSIPGATGVRILGYLSYIQLSSWALGENLLALMVASAHALLDQLSAALGGGGAPGPAAVLVTLGSILAVHSLFYVALLHVFYAILLRGLGLDMGWEQLPGFVRRMLGGLPAPGADLAAAGG